LAPEPPASRALLARDRTPCGARAVTAQCRLRGANVSRDVDPAGAANLNRA